MGICLKIFKSKKNTQLIVFLVDEFIQEYLFNYLQLFSNSLIFICGITNLKLSYEDNFFTKCVAIKNLFIG